MNAQLRDSLFRSWDNCAATTAAFLDTCTDDLLSRHVIKNRFESFAWEFACLIRTRFCYIRALQTGNLDFTESQDVPGEEVLKALSKNELVNLLSTTRRDINGYIYTVGSAKKISFLIMLLEHERLHHGKLMLYFSYIFMPLPELLIYTWGSTTFR